MSDRELAERVREALFYGAVAEAQHWADAIEDAALRREMQQLIQGYAQG